MLLVTCHGHQTLPPSPRSCNSYNGAIFTTCGVLFLTVPGSRGYSAVEVGDSRQFCDRDQKLYQFRISLKYDKLGTHLPARSQIHGSYIRVVLDTSSKAAQNIYVLPVVS